MFVSKMWSKFKAIRKCSTYAGITLNFLIQEATEENHEEVLNFMEKYYIGSETFNRAAGIYKSKDAIRELFSLYDLTSKDNFTLICYEDQDSTIARPIIGVSLMSLEKADDTDKLSKAISKVKTPEVKKLLNTVRVFKSLSGGMKTLGVEKWYDVNRICVHPDYTGLGIAKEFLKVGRAMCKEHEVPAASANMTAIGTQIAAERDGWSTTYKIPFDELGRLCECEFVDAPPTCKTMVAFADK